MNDSSEFDLAQEEKIGDSHILHSGKYFLLSKIKNNHRWEVLKTIQEKESCNPVCLRSLKMEFEIGSQLRHHGIVHYYQYQATPIPNFYREFIDGTQWLAFFRMNPSEIKNMKRYFHDLLKIIKYLHMNGVFHMDIKSENILITNDMHQVKLIDFGHAIHEKSTLSVGGTEMYQPPTDNGWGFHDVFALGKLMELTAQLPEAARYPWIKKTGIRCMKDIRNKNAILLSMSFKVNRWRPVPYFFASILGALFFYYFSVKEERETRKGVFNEKIEPETVQAVDKLDPIILNNPNAISIPTKTHTALISNTTAKKLSIEDSAWICNMAKTFGPEFKNRSINEKDKKTTYEIYGTLLDEYKAKWIEMQERWPDSTQRSLAHNIYLKEISLSLTPYHSYLTGN